MQFHRYIYALYQRPAPVSCESGYWKFEKWKWKKFSFTFCSRSEKWNENLIYSFREWKVKWKCFEIEIENEKWNKNTLSLRSRVKSEMKMLRDQDREVKFFEKFLRIRIFSFTHIAFFKCLFKLHTWVNSNLHWLHFVEFLHCWFQICPQITYFTVNIQMHPQIACLKGWKATLTTFLFDLSPLCFSSVSSNIHSKKMHCHNSCIGQNTPHSVSNSNILCSQETWGPISRPSFI